MSHRELSNESRSAQVDRHIRRIMQEQLRDVQAPTAVWESIQRQIGDRADSEYASPQSPSSSSMLATRAIAQD